MSTVMLPREKTTVLSMNCDWSALMPRSGNGLNVKQAHLIEPVHEDISADHDGHEGGRWGQTKGLQLGMPMKEEGERAVSVLPQQLPCLSKGGDRKSRLKIGAAVGPVVDERRDLAVGSHVVVFMGCP